MKTLAQLTAALFLFGTSLSWAGHEGHAHNHQGLPETKQVQGVKDEACENIVNVKMNGLVCDFCARALEKIFGKRDDVSGIDVDLDNGKVTIAMKAGKTIDDGTLTQLITDSGYNVVAINKGC